MHGENVAKIGRVGDTSMQSRKRGGDSKEKIIEC